MGEMLLAILLALAPAAQTAASGDEQRWESCSKEGSASLNDAIAACTSLIDSARFEGKRLGTAHYNRAVAHGMKGEIARAIADYDEAIRLNAADSSAFINRGIAFHNQGDHRKALADLDEAIRLDPAQEVAWAARGDVRAALEDNERATADYAEAIRLNPRDADHYYNRGLTWRRQGEDDKALADYNESIRLDPAFSDVHNNRGYIYFRRGDLTRAISDYRRAVELRPANLSAQANLCWAMTLKGNDLGRAREACDAVLATQDDLQTRVRRGVILYRQGRFQQAWADFDAAVRLDPEHGLPLYGRGLAESKLGRKAESEADIAAAVAKRPGVAAEYENYGIPRAPPG